MARRETEKMNKLNEYIKDRDYMIKNIENLKLEDFKNYCKKWKLLMPMPLFTKEEWVKGSFHKARLNVTKLRNTTPGELKELQEKSKKALDKLGWDYEIK